MKKYILAAAMSLLLLCITIPMGGYGGHPVKFCIANFLYCLLTYYFLKGRYASKQRLNLLLVITLPIILVFLPVHLISFEDTLYSLPSSVAHLTGIFAGAFLVYADDLKKAVFLPLFIATSIWGAGPGYSFWNNKVTYGVYSGIVDEPMTSFTLTNSNGKKVDLSLLKGKTVVLDFWHIGCGSCMRKFPELEHYYSESKQDKSILFLSVNVPTGRDSTGQAAAILKKLGYTFPLAFINSKALLETLNVNSYPTVLVISPEQRIVYRGQIDGIDTPLNRIAARNRHLEAPADRSAKPVGTTD